MARNLISTLIKISREIDRTTLANKREFERTTLANKREIERIILANKKQLREDGRARVIDEKERKRLYIEKRLSDVANANEKIEQHINRLDNLLTDGLKNKPTVNFEAMLVKPCIPKIEFENLSKKEVPPEKATYNIDKPSWIIGWLPTVRKNHLIKQEKLNSEYNQLAIEHEERDHERKQAIKDKENQHAEKIKLANMKAELQNQAILAWQAKYLAGDSKAIANYCVTILNNSNYPDNFPKIANISYLLDSKLLTVEYDFPSFEPIVPKVGLYKYIKATDTIISTEISESKRRNTYASLIAQTTLRSLYELFSADDLLFVDTIVFNGYVAVSDPGSGKKVRPCLVAMRTTRDVFEQLDLNHVEPLVCLKSLKASFSQSPAELAPVKPILNLNTIDPRFIQEMDVISELGEYSNLMDLTPSQFEALITNLFQKMGLDTKLTQASRDGGVDCVAFDQRPILGGKVVIQAKRYKNTVGVSAVRDLFGTMLNEGASKGILVTTSGYGKASFDFANGKPIELLDGSHLLYLLKEKAHISARIVMPIEWDGF